MKFFSKLFPLLLSLLTTVSIVKVSIIIIHAITTCPNIHHLFYTFVTITISVPVRCRAHPTYLLFLSDG